MTAAGSARSLLAPLLYRDPDSGRTELARRLVIPGAVILLSLAGLAAIPLLFRGEAFEPDDIASPGAILPSRILADGDASPPTRAPGAVLSSSNDDAVPLADGSNRRPESGSVAGGSPGGQASDAAPQAIEPAGVQEPDRGPAEDQQLAPPAPAQPTRTAVPAPTATTPVTETTPVVVVEPTAPATAPEPTPTVEADEPAEVTEPNQESPANVVDAVENVAPLEDSDESATFAS